MDAVWQRVTATSKPDNEGTDTTGVDLMELMNAECADRSLFLLLARMAGGCDGTLLRQIARDEAAISAVSERFTTSKTGRKYCPMQAAMPVWHASTMRCVRPIRKNPQCRPVSAGSCPVPRPEAAV